MIRSADRLRTEMELRQNVSRLRSEAHDGRALTPDDGWAFYAQERDNAEVRRLARQLSEISGDLEWAINGKGVYGSRVTFGTLTSFAVPLRGSLRWIQRDLIAVDGKPLTDVRLWDLIEPVFAGTFDGSFGMRVIRPPVTESLSLFDSRVVFDRAVERMITVFRVANNTSDHGEILGGLLGLRRNALSHLANLSRAVVDCEGSSQIRWAGGPVVSVSPDTAETVAEVIRASTPSHDRETIYGVLDGGRVSRNRFAIIADTEDPRKKRSVSGDLAAGVTLTELHLEQRVKAVIEITYQDSMLTAQPKPEYTLISIEALEDP